MLKFASLHIFSIVDLEGLPSPLFTPKNVQLHEIHMPPDRKQMNTESNVMACI